jgi:hypothetical protein
MGKAFYDLIVERDREKIRAEIQMAKSWAGSAMDGIEQSSFSYVTFTIEEPVSLALRRDEV